jgi:negative regulator of sigma E activity
MTDSVKEQLSACLDGELPPGELDLLLKRLERDPELRDSLGRYALLGEALRGRQAVAASRGFADKVAAALDAEPAIAPAATPAAAKVGRRGLRPAAFAKWLQPAAGMAIAAGVAAVAVLALQPSTLPTQQIAVTAATAPIPQPATTAPRSYTVPTNTTSDAYIPAARLTNYVVAHSEYSSPLGRRTVLSGVLSDDDDVVVVGGDAAGTAPEISDDDSTPEPAAPR